MSTQRRWKFGSLWRPVSFAGLASVGAAMDSEAKGSAFFVGRAGLLGGIALTWSLPFLWTVHRDPIASLDSELASAASFAISLLSCALLKGRGTQLQWPLPAVLLGLIALALIQEALGVLAYSQLAVRFVLYTSAMLIAYALGRYIVTLERAREAVTALAAAGLLGALFSVLVQWLQLLDVEVLPRWLAPVFREDWLQQRPFGNLGQPNHLATYLAVAAIGAFYLDRTCQRRWPIPVSLVALATGLAMTGSRMGLLFLLLLVALTFAPSALRPESARARWLTCAALVAGYVLGLIAVRWVVGNFDTFARMTQNTIPLRTELWRQAWLISLQHPWLGVGVGQFAGGQYWVARAGPYTLADNNSHNLILQVAAELGWPAAIAVVVLGFWWGTWNLARRLASPETALTWCMLLVIAIHSMLEFPLWYLYFTIPGALLFALGEPVGVALGTIDARRILPLAGAVMLEVVVAFYTEYGPVSKAALLMSSPDVVRSRVLGKVAAIEVIALADNRLFKPDVEYLLLTVKHPPDEGTNGPLERDARLLRVRPNPGVIIQYIVDLAKDGAIREAVVHVGRLRVFAGSDYAEYRDFILNETRDLGSQTAPLRHAVREAH